MATTIEQRIQSLPQELQNEILDYTLVGGLPRAPVTISADYRPPWQLSVDHRSRAIVQEAFYSGNLFVFYKAGGIRQTIAAWYSALSQAPENHAERPRSLCRIPIFPQSSFLSLP